jgi:hypothetical protein
MHYVILFRAVMIGFDNQPLHEIRVKNGRKKEEFLMDWLTC